MEEMFYLIEGEMTVRVAGEIHVLKPDMFCLVPRNAVHYFKITSAGKTKKLHEVLQNVEKQHLSCKKE